MIRYLYLTAMYTLEQIKDRQGKLSIKSHGESVFTDIQQAVNEIGYQARWFWELLQNAKDSVRDDETVAVKVKLSNKAVEFSHSGNPFNLDEILDLIIQGSSKRESENKTGRFGTGFISTYALSLKVQIAGILEDGSGFDFELDRDAADPKSFLALQEKCTKDFHASFIPSSELAKKEYDTCFTYPLSTLSHPIANSVLPKLKSILPYTLAFNEKIRQVIIDNDGTETVYSKSEDDSYSKDDGFKAITIKVNDKPFCDIVTKNVEDGIVAIRIDHVDDKRIVTDLSKDKVDLFFSFPLIGTEALQLPFVINSEKWGVKKERDGIFLGPEDTTNNNFNKKIITDALNLFPSFINWCKKNDVGSLYNLIKVRIHPELERQDNAWLFKEKIKLLEKIEQLELITCERNNALISMNDSFIPEAGTAELRKALWSLYDKFSADNIPLSDELEQWREVGVGYVELAGGSESRTYMSNVEKLCALISKLEKRDNLGTKIKGEISDFLNELYLFLTEEEHKFFFHYAIVLNQYNQIIKIEKTIRVDEFGDEELKNILVLLKQPTRTILVDNSLHLPTNICGGYSKAEAVNKITGLLAAQNEVNYSDNELRNASGYFLKWLIANQSNELIDTFQILTSGTDKSGGTVYKKYALGGFKGKKQKLLAPKIIWQNEFPLFADLVNDKECLHPVYADLLNLTEFEYLKNKTFIHLTPLIECRDNPSKNLLKQLLKFPGLIEDDRDEKDLKVEGKITYFDFAFFVNDEDYIFANNSSSRSSQRILEFVLKEAINKDLVFDTYNTIVIDGNETLIRNSIWVNRLRTSTWVNVNHTTDQGVSKFIGAPPSSFNLAIILNKSPELKELIKDEKVISLLSMLNVSVADLIRNTLTSEKEKMDWEKTFTSLLISGLDPELAEKMLKDPGLQTAYKKQIEEKDLIRRNQELGSKMEIGFQQIFDGPGYAELGIKVTRKPWGSDYVMTPDSSDLVNQLGQEELFEIGGWYIELKATGREYASMTPLQAKRAVENQGNYALVVLPLDGTEVSIENIMSKSKVVTNIGLILEPKHKEAVQADFVQDHLTLPDQFVEVYIEKSQIRYRVKSTLWENGMDLVEFIGSVFLKDRLV